MAAYFSISLAVFVMSQDMTWYRPIRLNVCEYIVNLFMPRTNISQNKFLINEKKNLMLKENYCEPDNYFKHVIGINLSKPHENPQRWIVLIFYKWG